MVRTSKNKGSGIARARRLLDRGRRSAERGKLTEGVVLLRQARESEPGFTEPHVVLGELLCKEQRWAEAYSCYAALVALVPEEAEWSMQAGTCCYHLHRFDRAAAHFAAALEADPGMAPAARNLANSLMLSSDHPNALRAFLHAFGLEEEHEQTLNALDLLLGRPEIYSAPDLPGSVADIEQALLRLYTRPGTWHQGLAPMTARILQAKHGIPENRPEPEALAREPLARLMLTQTVNVDLGSERLFIEIRETLIERVIRGERINRTNMRLMAALAQQCFNNEFLWPCRHQLSDIPELSDPIQPRHDEARLLAAALVIPLTDHPRSDQIATIPVETWSEPVGSLIRRVLLEPIEEAEIAEGVTSLTPIEDSVSRAVAGQYEEHPYPRWLNLRGHLTRLEGTFHHFFPETQIPRSLSRTKQILIAGCGTGQHALMAAHANPEDRVTAIDLSRRSLAYAKRKAEELGIANVALARADILGLTTWDQKFDHIEAMGVLHHMADPLAGWRVLTGLLTPGGTMRIGLYSERARAGVVAARMRIAEDDIEASAEGIRTFRARLIEDPGSAPLLEALIGLDFFATSSLRDLIFHVSEQRYTPARLAEEIEALGLSFIGFELGPDIRRDFEKRFPDDPRRLDFANWDGYEADHPDLFRGMYVFWVRKP